MTQALPRTAAVLLCLAVATLATGCGELPESAALGVHEAAMMRMDHCPSGNCPDPNNTLGIYVSNGAGYCIPGTSRSLYFCPERISRTSEAAFLVGQRLTDPNVWPDPPDYLDLRAEATYRNQGVTVTSMMAGPSTGGLIAHVTDGSNTQVLTGDELLDLTLHFSSPEFVFNLKFTSRANENNLWVYEVQYQVPALSALWTPYCQDGIGKAAFLPERWVSGLTGEMGTDESATTMACVSGAIGGCMSWGYKPWEAAPSDEDPANYLFGSCLQAKRAAYFAQSGDYSSYTVKGTPLSVQDMNGIMKADPPMPGVEALWSPQGAVCLSPQYRRTPAPGGQALPALPGVIAVPPCTAAIHEAAKEGRLQQELTFAAPLATGPASSP